MKKQVGDVGSYYGGLFIQELEGKYYWIIENYDTNFSDINEWSEISFDLYNQLIKHES